MATLSSDVPGAGVEVTGGLDRPPMPESASTTLVRGRRGRGGSREGLPASRGVAVGGGSDGNFTAAIGVPTLDGLGAVGGGAHADHEYVLVDTMIDRARLLAAIVARAASPSSAARRLWSPSFSSIRPPPQRAGIAVDVELAAAVVDVEVAHRQLTDAVERAERGVVDLLHAQPLGCSR